MEMMDLQLSRWLTNLSALLAFTYLQSSIEALENSVKYVQSLQQKHQNNVNEFLVTLFVTLNIFKWLL